MNCPRPDGDDVTVIDWGGASFHQSTLVKHTGTAPVLLRTYVIGRDGVIGISFGAKENTQIGDGDWRNLQVWVRRLTEPSGYDPLALTNSAFNGQPLSKNLVNCWKA